MGKKMVVCAHCGAGFSLDWSGKEKGVCPYCGMPVTESWDSGKDDKARNDLDRKVRMMEAENERLRLEIERMKLKRSAAQASNVRPVRQVQRDISSSVSKAVSSFSSALYNSFVRLLKSSLVLGIILAIVAYVISPIDFLSGIPVDDILVIFLGFSVIKAIRSS